MIALLQSRGLEGGILRRTKLGESHPQAMNSLSLCEPISAEAPCGVDLEDTQLLASFDAFRVFGSDVPLRTDLDWRAIRDQAQEALAQSHDLRLLAHLTAATLRIEGVLPFCELLCVAERWLRERWELVFPRVDEDALLRKNALNCLADRMAVVDPLRRAALVTHRQLGTVSLRDMDLATGQLAPGEADTQVPSQAQIEATLAATSSEVLAELSEKVAAACSAVRAVVALMQDRAGFQSAPDLEPLLLPITRIQKVLSEHLASRGVAQAGASATDAAQGTVGEAVAASAVTVGDIRSRQDAARALEAIATFFRRNEPSSPVPLLLERAQRLISKSFIEVLEDMAPDGLTQARLIGGIKVDEGG